MWICRVFHTTRLFDQPAELNNLSFTLSHFRNAIFTKYHYFKTRQLSYNLEITIFSKYHISEMQQDKSVLLLKKFNDF